MKRSNPYVSPREPEVESSLAPGGVRASLLPVCLLIFSLAFFLGFVFAVSGRVPIELESLNGVATVVCFSTCLACLFFASRTRADR